MVAVISGFIAGKKRTSLISKNDFSAMVRNVKAREVTYWSSLSKT